MMFITNVFLVPDLYTSEECSNDICWSKVVFKWPYPKKCSGKFVCKNLRGNICGSYGLIFAHNSDSQSLCQERQTISFSNTQGFIKCLTLWLWFHSRYGFHIASNEFNLFTGCRNIPKGKPKAFHFCKKFPFVLENKWFKIWS